MGSTVLAICKCGVHKTINIGGGMKTFREIQYFPFKCQVCRDVVQSNALGKPPRCPNCGSTNVLSYNDPSLKVKEGESTVDQCFNLMLSNGIYKCGRCDQETLKFVSTGFLWD